MSCGSQIFLVAISSPVCCQDAPHRRPADRQAAGDFGFADARTVELPYLVSVEGCRYWPAQALAVLAGVGQAGAYPFAENFPLELRILQLFAKCGLCGGRDYAKPPRRSSRAACMSAMWDSALYRLVQGRGDVARAWDRPSVAALPNG